MTGNEYADVARGLYGPRFVAPLARDLGVRRDTVYRILESPEVMARDAAALCGLAVTKGGEWQPLAVELRENYGVREIKP